MRGVQCEQVHAANHSLRQKERSTTLRLWIFQEIPEMIVGKWKRVNSFLN